MSLWPYINYSPNAFFYTTRDKLYYYMLEKSKKYFRLAEERRASIKSKEDLISYQKEMRAWFIESMGSIPYDKNYPLNAKTTGVIEEENLTIEKVLFTAREGVYVTGNLYLPKNREEKAPAILFQLGHSDLGKANARYQSVARILASYGLIVFSMDPVGQGERSGYMEKELSKPMIARSTPDHQMGGDPCFLTGFQSQRYFIADAMRGIDYLLTRSEVDPERIGATGSSGGGTQTAVIALCDDRVKAAAPGTFITNREEYIYAGSAQDSEQIWFGSTKKGFDHYELLACVAPKPYMILVADSDFFPIEGARKVYEENKKWWSLLGNEKDLEMYVDRTLHAYTDNLANAAGEFFKKAFSMNVERVNVSTAPLPEKEVNVTKSGHVSLDFPDARFLYEENKLLYDKIKKEKEKMPKEEREEKAREFLKKAMYEGREETPLEIRTFGTEYDNGLRFLPYMWFTQPQLPNTGMLFTSYKTTQITKNPVIFLCDKGTNALDDIIDNIREVIENGGAAFVVDLSGVGTNEPHDLNSGRQVKDRYGALDRITKDMFFNGDSLCALRLFELEKAVEVLKTFYPESEPEIFARGLSNVYAELYKIVHPETKITTEGTERRLERLVEDKYYENYNISGILLPEVLKYI